MSVSDERALSLRVRLIRKMIHSSRDERKAVEAATRWREVSARPSRAAQKAVKNWDSGEIVMSEVDEITSYTCLK